MYQETKFQLDRTNYENFPCRHQVYNVMSIDMTLQKWAIFIMGIYREISHFLWDPTEIWFLVI